MISTRKQCINLILSWFLTIYVFALFDNVCVYASFKRGESALFLFVVQNAYRLSQDK